MHKLSITIDEEAARGLRERVGRRNVSAFVNTAIHHELERASLRELLDDLEQELGPPDVEMVRAAAAAFDEVESRVAAARPRRRRGSKRR